MRLRPKRFRAAVTATYTRGRPIRLTLGPALIFDVDLDEAHELAVALIEAVERVRQRGGDR